MSIVEVQKHPLLYNKDRQDFKDIEKKEHVLVFDININITLVKNRVYRNTPESPLPSPPPCAFVSEPFAAIFMRRCTAVHIVDVTARIPRSV